MSPPWQFVSNQRDGSAGVPETRKLVREHAMRSFRRRQRLQEIEKFRHEQIQVNASDDVSSQVNAATSITDNTPHRASMQGKVLQERQDGHRSALHDEQTALVKSGSGTALDPFHQTAMCNNPDATRLFMHFVRDIAPKLQHFAVHGCGNPLVSLLPLYALRDPMMLESILFHAAVHDDVRNGRPWTASTWYHRGRSIELVNQRLALPGDESTSDFVIGAVSFIGSVGNITGDAGDVKEDLVHRRALRKMVEMRGGPERLGCNGILAMMLPIGDLISSAVSDSIPTLERPNIDAAAMVLGLEIPGSVARPVESSLGLPSFCIEIVTLILFIDKLAALQADSTDTLIASTDNMIAFSQVCSAVEHRLLSVRTHDTQANALVYEAVRIAGLICMTYLFRKMNRTAAINLNLHKRFRAAISGLESWPTFMTDEMTMRLLLWALSVASLTAVDPAWFVEPIKRGLLILGIGNLGELSNFLGFLVWTSRMMQDFGKVSEQLWPVHEA